MNNDNIVAIATAEGFAGIGIVRVSGNNLTYILNDVCNIHNIIVNKATYCNFLDKNKQIIDSGIVIYFKAPNSFTGEDVIELQGHGSPIVLQLILERILQLNCRLATSGEFSRRAYLNGKIDLLQAESIIDLIHAESALAARSAIKSLKGSFSSYINDINQQLIHLRMFVEATLDFPEEDIEFIASAKIHNKLTILVENIKTLLKNTKQGVLINNGANIVIVGRPNVGKSSLLNALANEEVAIVTDIAGTTRDVIKEKIMINGIVFNIIDTAGIRLTTDTIEQIGIKRTINTMQDAQICLVLIDETIGIAHADNEILRHIPENIPRLFVHNKIDLIASNYTKDDHAIYISAKNRLGIDSLKEQILKLVGYREQLDVFSARTRHLDVIRRVVKHINNAFDNWHNLELLAEELRYSHNALTEITGEFSSDDLLGEIFSKFCIGK